MAFLAFPVTLGTALTGAPLSLEAAAGLDILTAGVGLGALGQYQAGVAAQAEARSAAAVAEYNAKVQEQEAKAIEQQTLFKQRRQAEEASRLMGSMRAAIGAAGVVPSEGTPLLIQAQQARESELENLMLGYEGQIGAGRARSQAAIERAQASIYKQRGRYAGMSGLIGAGTTLLTGFGAGKAYGYW